MREADVGFEPTGDLSRFRNIRRKGRIPVIRCNLNERPSCGLSVNSLQLHEWLLLVIGVVISHRTLQEQGVQPVSFYGGADRKDSPHDYSKQVMEVES